MAEASSKKSTCSTCDRRPNVTLDNDGIRREKSLQCCKTRSAAKACITRKIKELTELFTNRENVADVRKGAQEFKEIATNFWDTHNAYHATLDDDFEIQDSQEYFECENQGIVNFQQTLEEWFSRWESEINSHDLVSKSRSKSSRTSLHSSEAVTSAASPWTIAAAKRALLTAEATALRQQQNLQEEELRLKEQQEEARIRLEQHKQQLQPQTEIPKMEAEEQVWLNKEPLLSIAFPCSDTGPHTILASYSATPTSTLCLRPIRRKRAGHSRPHQGSARAKEIRRTSTESSCNQSTL